MEWRRRNIDQARNRASVWSHSPMMRARCSRSGGHVTASSDFTIGTSWADTSHELGTLCCIQRATQSRRMPR